MEKTQSSANKLYVVLRASWEYNDEYYYKSDNGGNPVLAFHSRQKANEHCENLNVQGLYGINLQDYCSEDYHHMESELMKLGVHGSVIPKKTDRKTALKILKLTGLKFYTVSEVPIEVE